MVVKRCVPLEPAAEEVCDENSNPPFIFQLPPAEGRKLLDKVQDSPVYKCPANIITRQTDTGCWGNIRVHGVVPQGLTSTPSLIFYIHGAGWVFGNLHTHDKLVRELASRTNSILIFPEYSLSPEAKYPTAIEQCYAVLCRLPEVLKSMGLSAEASPLTVAGDSVGGNMATVMCLLSKERKGPKIHKQLLFYPVTNACFSTCTYKQFAAGYYLYRAGMKWFWDQYTKCESERREITASPLLARTSQLCGLPPAMIINGEADVLRSEGEAYAERLRAAGVEVTALRLQAIIHDFVMLNALDQTNACRAAMDASTEWVNRKDAEPDCNH